MQKLETLYFTPQFYMAFWLSQSYENKQFFSLFSPSVFYVYTGWLIASISYRDSKASFRDTEHILSW
ncbi:MAG: hypothetical protein SPJ29_03925 [Phocaeicola sp.]|nr:hypothetical protein [Phocaeicola sp.]MDD7447663.1 hypothetical protein [Prevotellaceae bacterium]MDY5938885.1 hypothetical protein [Phocaeicola sp.]